MAANAMVNIRAKYVALFAITLATASVLAAQAQVIRMPEGTTTRPPEIPTSACSEEDARESLSMYSYNMHDRRGLGDNEPYDFPGVCPTVNATAQFNDPCAWAGARAQLAFGVLDFGCLGSTRQLHWHHAADEWGYVTKGTLLTYIAPTSATSGASSAGMPWEIATNKIGPGGVWYFPQNWLHGITCLTPESEGGCKAHLTFLGAEDIRSDGHNLDTTFAQATEDSAASALGIGVEDYLETIFPRVDESGGPLVGSQLDRNSPTFVPSCNSGPELGCPDFWSIPETTSIPAAFNNTIERRVDFADGVTLHQIRTTEFPFSRTMSQERVSLDPGAIRPLVWTTEADAVLAVVEGKVTVRLQGGVEGVTHTLFVESHLLPDDAVYIPLGRAFEIVEETGTEPAEVVLVFSTGDWAWVELAEAVSPFPDWAVYASLNATDLTPSSSVSKESKSP